jgi:uncharacterized protein YjbJ (UPF0337 family)
MDRENTERQVKGKAQSLVGRIKEGFNKMFGSHQGELEGRADDLRGRASEAGSKIRESAGEAGSRIKESATNVKNAVGERLGKEKENVEDKRQQQVHR